MNPIRNLRPDEVELRISKINGQCFELLAYKNSRTDMDILDETQGAENWQREHKEINGTIYCGVSIWSEKRNQFITKWDAGSESFSDKEKGAASDSFKRACVNFGIGRELYSTPSIKIWDSSYTTKNKKDKYVIYEKFKVTEMKVEDGKIISFAIADEKGKQVFCHYEGKKKVTTTNPTASQTKETTPPANTTTSDKKYLSENYNEHKVFVDRLIKKYGASQIKYLKATVTNKVKLELEKHIKKIEEYKLKENEEIFNELYPNFENEQPSGTTHHFPGMKEKESILALVNMGEPYKSMFYKLLKYYKVDNITKLEPPQAQAALKKMKTVSC